MDSDNCDLEYRLPLLGDSLNLAGLQAITKQIKGGLISEGIFSPQIKFIFSKKATKIDEIFTVDLTLKYYIMSNRR